MGKAILAALAVAASSCAATAGQTYDRNLERAVMEIVAAKIGELRSGFDVGQKPVFVRMIDSDAAMPILAPGVPHGAMASEDDSASPPKGGPAR